MEVVEIETARGPARAQIELPARSSGAAGALILGHGAGGGIQAKDLLVAAEAARGRGLAVVLVDQPYRVAGRKAPAPAPHLDQAWVAVVEHLRANHLRDHPLIVGGRSMGARVACRTAAEVGAIGVLCLAFPERPPQRRGKSMPPSRQAELDAVVVPTLVVQGIGDPFGMPRAGPSREIVKVAGNHSLTSDLDAVAAAVEEWLARVLP
ncbi:MAG: alpha/beta fold hydrolase [Actinomycetota bacterium]|nr:alpha/beta fold hydrolase [Actinomycetota bacterium]